MTKDINARRPSSYERKKNINAPVEIYKYVLCRAPIGQHFPLSVTRLTGIDLQEKKEGVMPVKRPLERPTINFLMRLTKLSIKRPAARALMVSQRGAGLRLLVSLLSGRRVNSYSRTETRPRVAIVPSYV